MRHAGLLLAAAVGTLVALLPALLHAQQDPVTLERRVKAAFIYKFPEYVEWPEGTFAAHDSPLTIGVLGDDALAAELAQISAGRAIESRPLAVRRLGDSDPSSVLAGLQVLFVAHAARERLPALRADSPPQLLVISESEGALNQGSVINFLISGGRVRFEIALDNAEKRRLKLSARLLTVAHFVRMASPP